MDAPPGKQKGESYDLMEKNRRPYTAPATDSAEVEGFHAVSSGKKKPAATIRPKKVEIKEKNLVLVDEDGFPITAASLGFSEKDLDDSEDLSGDEEEAALDR